MSLAAAAQRSQRLGAQLTAEAVEFRVFSRHATSVQVCLFDRVEAVAPSDRVPLERRPGGVWETRIAGLRPGQLYGLRADGPFRPSHGHRFNPAKLLVDPYALAITGEPQLSPRLFAFDHGSASPTFNGEDSAGVMPKCVVVDREFDWCGDRFPRRPWNETLIYECHLRGMTMRHPEVADELRGTYAGLASEPIIEHLQRLGITAVELLPIHQIASEPALLERGLRNFWGYSTLGYFAPNARYATGSRGEQVREFKGHGAHSP